LPCAYLATLHVAPIEDVGQGQVGRVLLLRVAALSRTRRRHRVRQHLLRDFFEHSLLQLSRRLVVKGLYEDGCLSRWHQRLL